VRVGAIGGGGTVATARAPEGAATVGGGGVPSAAAAGTLSIGGDLRVNRLGFGAMRLTGPGIWGEPKDPAEACRVLQRAVELGVNFIDTADSYGPDVSERLIAAALFPYPQGLTIATKGGMVRPGPGDWAADGRPQHLREACEGSLQRLRLQRIDLYQLHRIDPQVPLEDSLGELARLREQGKIRHIGVSNFTAAQLVRARRVVPVVSVQNRFNVSDRSSADVLQLCAREGLAFIPWAPLPRAAAEDAASRALASIAAAHGVSVQQAAIAWLLAISPAMLPIPGTASAAHLEENLAAARLRLTAAELAALG
jgi:pyridoxine 4-dehydrogenase